MFTVLVTKICRNIKKIKSFEMQEFGLKGVHVSCLYYLYKSDGLTAAELCLRCGEDKAGISRSLEHLETNGYLLCQDKGKKRYNASLQLTDRGLETGKLIADKIDQQIDAAGAGMNEEERAVFYKCLSLINENLEQICAQHT